MKKFYITTPIYYVNDRPHIGHAYTTIAADILARYHRLIGDKVFFLTGADEHGAKVAESAEKFGKSPQEHCNEQTDNFKKAWRQLNISNDGFLRTTDKNHISVVQKVLQILWDKKFIYKGKYQGFYCTGCEQYKTKSQLVDGKCPEHQREPEILSEECYFFKLSTFQDELLERITKDTFEIQPEERKNEIISFLKKEKLQDVAFSRKNVQWGIPLPFDKSHTTYVWVDAFLNYLTGLDWRGNSERLPEFWPPDIQLMSKDILRVHTTIWPGILLALDIPLPKKLFVHGYFTIKGQKMSKSLGNVICPTEMVEKFGADAVRYLILSATTFGHDGDISWEKLTEKYNADLANGLGNLVSRVVKLSQISNLKSQISKTKIDSKKIKKLFQEFKLKEILDEIWRYIKWADKFIDEKKLWELVKTNPAQAKKDLSELLSLILEISNVIAPLMPGTSEKISQILKTNKTQVLFPRV